MAPAGFGIGPGEKLDNGIGADFPDKLKRTLNFPFVYFIVQAGMNADLRVIGLDGLRRPQWSAGRSRS